MGNSCSILSSAATAAAPFMVRGWDYIVKHANYICKLEETLGAFSGAHEELVAKRNDVKLNVDLAQQQQLKSLDEVQLWVSKAEIIMAKAENLIEDDLREKISCALEAACPRIAYLAISLVKRRPN